VIDVPKDLNKDQQEAVEELSKAFNGDPRAGLFAASASTRSASEAKEDGDGSA